MSKGFVVLAKNTDTVDYVKQAYALALSIRYSQKTIKNITLVTNDAVPKEYKFAFDNILPIPWMDNDINSVYSTEHRWKLYYVSPYEETIVLDTDMLLLEDISSWWNHCSKYDIQICSKIKNYKLETVVDTYHRTTFIENKLSNPYIALHYFKKSIRACEFYKVLEFVSNNWEWCYGKFTPEFYQDWLSMDVVTAITIEIMGLHDEVFDINSPLEFIHMKPPLQGWKPVPESWQDTVNYILNRKGELIVGNIKQGKLFHYVEKNFLSSQIIKRLEELEARNGK